MKSKLKNLPDGSKFKLSERTPVVYKLDKLDHKRKVAIYTSTKSGKTFESGWGKEVWVCAS
jgi:hypothetical protein